MYAQLGDIVFNGTLSPESQEHSKAANYAEHALIDGKPRLQKIGNSLDEIKLTMHLHVMFCNPEAEVGKLNTYMADGTSLRYVTGAGLALGSYVVTSTKQVNATQSPTGEIIETTFEVSLKEVVEESNEDSISKAAINAGFAQSKNDPAVEVQKITPITATSLASQSVTSSLALNQTGGLNLQKAQGNPSQFSSRMKAAAVNFKDMNKAVSDAVQKVNDTSGDVYQKTRDLESALINTQSQIDQVRAFSESENITEALSSFDALQPLMYNVRRESEVLAGYNSSRIAIDG